MRAAIIAVGAFWLSAALVLGVLCALGGCALMQPNAQCYSIQGIIEGSNVAVLFNNCTGKFDTVLVPGLKSNPDPVSSTPEREPSKQPGI